MNPFPALLRLSVPLAVGLLVAACARPTETNNAPAHESEEIAMMALLEQVATMRVEAYDPKLVIETVNALQPLGKEAALAQVDAYLQKPERPTEEMGLFWLLRVLFDVPGEAGFPPLRLGQPTLPPPPQPDALPRFPIVMVQEVPFLASRGYFLAGMAEPVRAHVDYYRTHGTLRAAPLTPPDSAAGLEEAFLQQWRDAYGDAHSQEAQSLVREQIARLRR